MRLRAVALDFRPLRRDGAERITAVQQGDGSSLAAADGNKALKVRAQYVRQGGFQFEL